MFGPECDIDYYDRTAAKVGVTRALVIPTLTHELRTEDFTERSCIWTEKGEEVVYQRELVYKNGSKKVERDPANPYHLMNQATLEKVRELNKQSRIRYYFLPKVHPILDDEKEVRGFVRNQETVGLKVHGLAAHITPEQMPEWIVELANRNDKAVYVHTDYYNRDYSDERTPDYLLNIISKNTPKSWISWAEKTRPKRLYLAHLVRMDPEAIEFVNESRGVITGLGPDFMLQNELIRLKRPTSNILHDALTLLKPTKLVFSTDFAWNVFDRRNWGSFDWQTKDRLSEEAAKLGLDESLLDSVMFRNAIRFFRLN